MEHDTTDEPLDAEGAGATALRGSALRSGGYAVGVLLSVISAPLLIRHLGLDEFGVFVTISSIVAIISGASELGLTSVGVREWAQRPPEARQDLLADLLGARLSLTLVGIGGAFAFAVLAGYDATRLAGVAVACGGLLITSLQAALVVPLSATLKQGRVAAADVVRQAVQVTLIVALVVGGSGLVLLLATAIPAAAAAFVVTARGVPGGLPRPAIRPRRWVALLKDTLPFAAASAVSVLYLRATVILTSLVATEAATGAFSAAFRVLEVLINVPSLLVGALFPLLARAAAAPDDARLRMSLERTWSGAFAVGGLTAVFVAAGAPVAILILSGDTEPAAVDSLRILGAGLGFSFVGSACQYGLLALRRHREILYINLGALTINVALTLLLAGPHGAVGAATALGISEVLVTLAASTLLIRAGGLHVDTAAAGRMLAAVAAGAAVAVALTPVSILAAAVVAPLVATGISLVLRAVPAELIAMVPRRATAAT